MTNYKNLLLALGITISGVELANAKENSLHENSGMEDLDGISHTTKKSPSPIFLEVDTIKDMTQEDHNVGCSVTNSGC